MHTLNFKNDAKGTLSKLVAFASDHPRRKPYTQTTTKEIGVWLVKDDGIYLMSSTNKNFCLSETHLTYGFESFDLFTVDVCPSSL